MNVLVIGAGEVGYHLAKFLSKEDHRVTLVDVRGEALVRASRNLDVQTIAGSGSDVNVLLKAGVEKADLLVAVTAVDELNMLASMIGKRLGARRTVVRVHAGLHVQENQYFYKDTLGFDLTISPGEMAALEIIRICRGQNSLPVENFAGGRLQMRRLEILEDSPSAGQRLADIRLPSRALVTGIARGTEVLVPRGDEALKVGDFAMLIGAPGGLDKAERAIGGRRDLPKRVMIVGGGTVAMQVAKDLAPLGITVRIIEKDAAAAEELSSRLEGAEVVCGSGTDQDLLMEEGVGRTDVFVSLGRRDEGNLIACQLARNLGAARTVALVNKPDYAALVNRLGIDHSVSPRRLVAKRIAQYVRGGARGTIATIYRGAAEVVDLVVPEGFPQAGRELREIAFPQGSIVGGLIRGDDVVVPHGDTKVLRGDHLIVFAVIEVLQRLEHVFDREEAPSGEAGD